MPNNNKTELVVILDRSGSMVQVQADMEGGLNQLVKDQKEVEGECLFTLVQFDTEYEFVHTAVPIADVPHIPLAPRGATALLDAVGRTITGLHKRLENHSEEDRPGKVVVVTITDGYENSSREFTKDQVKKLIEEHPNWEFVFLGANQDAFAEAGGIGIGHGTTSGYTGQTVAASVQNLSKNVGEYRSGAKADMRWTQEQREEMDPEEARKKEDSWRSNR